MKYARPTITIGIPAYNEEANIGNLLEDLRAQKTRRFSIAKIIVACDAPSDHTVEIVKRHANHDRRIKLVWGRKRMGQTARLNQLFHLNTSDYLVCFDADVALPKATTLETLVMPLTKSSRVGLVGANLQPAKAENAFEHAMNVMFEIWFQVRLQYLNGHNIFSHLGAAFAIKRELAQRVNFPAKIVANQHFLYITTIEKGWQFKFERKAKVVFRSPSCLADYRTQGSRALTEKAQLVAYFGEHIRNYFVTPASYKFKAIAITFLHSPLFTSVGLGLLVWIRLYSLVKSAKKHSVLWDTPISTKRAVLVSNAAQQA
jgi:cellulose synthase/poly-beta-1,6-N-acetylglucosamine synthase-like glycosyltransferase